MIQAKRAYVKEGKKISVWLRLVALGVGVYLMWVLGKGMFELRSANKRIDEAKQVLMAEEARNRELKERWTEVQTSRYIEQVARNDLNMQKEGETVVVMSASSFQSSEIRTPEIEEKDVSNWKKWWNLIR